MGTTWYIDGEIRIDPPLNHSQIKTVYLEARAGLHSHHATQLNRISGQLSSGNGEFPMEDYYSLSPSIETDERETDEGTVKIRRCSVLIPCRPEGKLSPYSIEDQVNRMIALFPGNTFSGEIVAVSERYGEAFKVVVEPHEDAEKIEGKPAIVWEDGSKPTTPDL